MNKLHTFILGGVAGSVLTVVTGVGGLAYLGSELAEAGPGLAGTYVCPSGCIYQAIEIRGGGHAVVHGMGLAVPTTYSATGDRIYLRSDQGDLGFRIVDADTLEGEGWAEGTYTRR